MLRMPRTLSDPASRQDGASLLDMEILAEQAAALGHAGAAVQQALQMLKACPADDPARPARVIAAAQAVQAYLVQLELTGIHHRGNYDSVLDAFAVPREVMAKIGVRG